MRARLVCATGPARIRRRRPPKPTHTPRAGIARACPKRGPMQRRSLAAAIGIVIVTLACVCGLYVHFIQEKVHDESADHLKEIYSQVNNTFSMLVSDNWNHLSTWNTMFEDSAPTRPTAPFPATTPSRRASS